VVELAYAGDTAAMDILLPDEGNFEAFESALNSNLLDQTLDGLQPASFDIFLPKFTFESSFDLSETLKSMGMVAAFDPASADLSGMTGKKDLFISDVIHKAFVAVDEAGTEAAAATGAFAQITSAMFGNPDVVIDRPFIFIIRDKPSGQILFIGRVLDPTQ